jgi:small subunit ribosomal protein S4e
VSDHQKRLSAPETWPVGRKTGTFTVKADAGPHGGEGVPLVILLRDVLGYVDSLKEAQYALNQDTLEVNGDPVSDPSRPIGMFDILAFTERGEYYRVFPDEGGRLALTGITETDARSKLGKVVGKRQVSGGRTQLNLHDGSNHLVETDAEYGVNDSLILDNDEGSVVAQFPYEEGCLVTAVRGSHSGEIGRVTEIDVTPGSSSNRVVFESAGGDLYETVEEYVVVIDEQFAGEEWTEAESEVETEAESEVETEAESESEVETEAESESEVETEVESESEVETEVESEAEIEADSESESEAEDGVEAESEVEVEADSESVSEVEAESESESEVEAESESESEVEAESESESEVEVEADSESVSEVETDAESEAEVETEAESESEIEAESESESEAEDGVEAESEVESVSEVETEAESESEAEDGVEAESDVEDASKATAESPDETAESRDEDPKANEESGKSGETDDTGEVSDDE